MEWSERMNSAIDYIENNLDSEIDINEAAEKACCSSFHFQRMFFAIIGITPAEYARRRRLTLAATELSAGDAKVIDVALKYGYDSPNAFTRAFRNMHGINPQAARASGVKLTAFPRVSFHIELKGGSIMDYKIIEKPAFESIGKTKKFSNAGNQNLVNIPKFWEEFCQSGDEKILMNLNDGKPGSVTGADYMGICIPIKGNTVEFNYSIAVEKADKEIPPGFELIKIPAATWAVFDSYGPMPGAIQNLTREIYQEWFPSTGYEQDSKPDLEVYLPGDTNSKNYHCQVWVPIMKKK